MTRASPDSPFFTKPTRLVSLIAATTALVACSNGGEVAHPLDVEATHDAADDAVSTSDGVDTGLPADIVADVPDSGGPTCEPLTGTAAWSVLTVCREPGELLAVGGTSWHDVWVVGAGGVVLHFDGCGWSLVPSGTTEDLWWVHAFEGGHAVVSGAAGTLLRMRQGEAPVAIETGTASILFGVWGSSPDDLWSVGFDPKGGGEVILRVVDSALSTLPVPVPAGATIAAPFKVSGSGPDDVWIVGRDDLVLHYDGEALSPKPTGAGSDGDWVTVVMSGGQPLLVGGASNARVAERAADGAGWLVTAPTLVPALQGVCNAPGGGHWATGIAATILKHEPGGEWTFDDDAPLDLFSPFDPPVPGCGQPTPDYHACWADDRGNVYVVGGNFLTLGEGALLFRGAPGMPPLP